MVPIKSITGKRTSDKFVYLDDSSEPGPCAKLLGSLLDDIYKGKAEDRFWWLFRVKEPNLKTNGSLEPKLGNSQVNSNGEIREAKVHSNGQINGKGY
jgi:hypothetical protein